MPTTTSAKKRLKQSIARRARNRSARAALKSVVRKARAAIAAGDLGSAEAGLRLAAKKLDQAAAGRLIHANAAARLKSRLSAGLKQAKQRVAG